MTDQLTNRLAGWLADLLTDRHLEYISMKHFVFIDGLIDFRDTFQAILQLNICAID